MGLISVAVRNWRGTSVLPGRSLHSWKHRDSHFWLFWYVSLPPYIWRPETNKATGLCHLAELSESSNTCIRVAGLPKGSLSEHLKLENTDRVTEDLLESGLSLTSRVLCPIFAATGLLFLCGTLAFLLLEVVFSEKEDMDKVTVLTRHLRWIRTLTLTVLLIVCAMGFVVVSTIAIAATGMHFEIQGSDESSLVIVPGKTLRILQWFTLSFSGLIAVGVVDLLRAKRRPAESTRVIKTIGESYSDL